MSTHNRMVTLAALLLLPLAGAGCGSRFAGEWVQESAVLPDGTLAPVSGERRVALRFDPPTSVRVGMYLDAAGVVEAGTVALSEYQTLQNRSVAQFGAYTARVEEGQLVTYIGGEEAGRFRRMRGRSVFPSRIQLPHLAQAGPPAYANNSAAPPPEALAGAPRPTRLVVAGTD